MLLAVLLLSVAATHALPLSPSGLCGHWELTNCSQKFGTTNFIKGSWSFDGISTGTYIFEAGLYDDAACSVKLMNVSHTGSYVDLGPSILGTNGLMLVPFSFVVTPYSQTAADKLNQQCPCDGNWAADTVRTLTHCSPLDCTDTTFLGGDNKKGIQIGQALFGTSWVDTQLTNSVYISEFDYDMVEGKINPSKDRLPYAVDPTASCGPVVDSTDICHEWLVSCAPAPTMVTQVQPNIVAVSRTFVFAGTADFNSTQGTGYFERSVTYYGSTSCDPASAYMNFYETGTIQALDTSEEPGGYFVSRNSPGVTVTPLTDDASSYLETACPCGSDWTTAQTRRLTTCPPTHCIDVSWYDGITIGDEAFGNVLSWANNNDNELLLSQFSSDEQKARTSGFSYTEPVYGTNEDDVCPTQEVSFDYCGSWKLECSSGLMFDYIEQMTWDGRPDPISGLGGGAVVVETDVYDSTTGTNCGNGGLISVGELLSFTKSGFWSTENDPNDAGVLRLLLKFDVVSVTPKSAHYVSELNEQCPCGGSWKLNKARDLVICPANSCKDGDLYFGGGVLGQPGFGRIIRTQDTTRQLDILRITDLDANSTVGYANPFGVENFPLSLSVPCNDNPIASKDYCGTFIQPCRLVDNINPDLDFEAVFTYDNFTGEYFETRTAYLPDVGCSASSIYFRVEQKGLLNFTNDPTVVPNGTAAHKIVSELKVTTYTAKATFTANQLCKCGNGDFSINVPRILKDCPLNTCTIWPSFLLQAPVTHVYGSIQRLDQQIRMTVFNSTVDAWNMPFSTTDFSLQLEPTMPCGYVPQQHVKGKESISGGTVLLIIFFVAAFIYFAGGMALNMSRTGSASVPHSEFWRTLPGYIAEGINFSICNCCGLANRGSSGYTDMSKSVYGTVE